MLFYWFAWLVTKIAVVFLFPLKVYGRENLPLKGTFILAGNHRSYLDPVVIPISCTRKLNFVVRETLFDNKLMGWYLRNIGGFPIKRKSSDVRAIKEILKRLNNDIPVLIFPEGTRHSRNDDNVAEAGIGFIAVKSGVPVIPVNVSGSDIVLPPGSKKIKRSLIKVTFGRPVIFSKGDSYQNIANNIMEKILQLD